MSKQKKPKQNFYDHFIDELIERFSRIPNFNLTQEDELGKEQFNFVLRRFTEVHSLKSLFINYYIPASNKSIADDLNQISKSKYKSQIRLTREELKENYYETVRLGYVAVFHKFEAFIAECLEMAEKLTKDVGSDSKMTVVKFAEKELDFKIKNWRIFPSVERINWVCNCVKHYDGYPRKEPKPYAFNHFSEQNKLRLTKEDFVRDVKELDEIYLTYLQLIYTIAMYKMMKERGFDESFINDEKRLEYTEKKKKLDEQINKYIDHFRA